MNIELIVMIVIAAAMLVYPATRSMIVSLAVNAVMTIFSDRIAKYAIVKALERLVTRTNNTLDDIWLEEFKKKIKD